MSADDDAPYVGNSGNRYTSWDALVQGEANGFAAVAIMRERAPKGTLFPWVVGPFITEREARNATRRMRNAFRHDDVGVSELVSTHVRPTWKDAR